MGVIDVLLGAVNELHQHKTEQHEANATHYSDKDFIAHSYVTTCSSPHLSNPRGWGLPLPLLKEGCSSHRCYPMHDITPKVPAIAVRMAMIILSICFQSISFMFV